MWHQNAELKNWLERKLQDKVLTIDPIPGDASVRQFVRIKLSSKNLILMLAPVDHAFHQFLALSEWLRTKDYAVPTVYAVHLSQGWIVMTDFGPTTLFKALAKTEPQKLYENALASLHQLQSIELEQKVHLPVMDQAYLTRQVDDLFLYWFLKEYLKLSLDPVQIKQFRDVFNLLLEKIIQQPYLLTHVDYHSRNLMVNEDNDMGVIDFQDAAIGPITYDLASLLNDCYVVWPREQVESWCYPFYEKLLQTKKITPMSFEAFMMWFDLTALQRHLKNFGIFTRLSIRDGKHGYLPNVSTLVTYVEAIMQRYDFLAPLETLFKEVIFPALNKAQETVVPSE